MNKIKLLFLGAFWSWLITTAFSGVGKPSDCEAMSFWNVISVLFIFVVVSLFAIETYKELKQKQSFISKKMKEFEKGFTFELADLNGRKMSRELYKNLTIKEIKDFLTLAFTEFAEEIRLEKKKIVKKFSTDERRFPHGYNSAKADLDKNIDEMLGK